MLMSMNDADVERKPVRGFIRELDGLRGIAILVVMLHRFWPLTGPLGRYASAGKVGWMGVDLFFVISGFLITGILLDTKSDAHCLQKFYARRALRILPLYYLYVGAVLAVVPLSQGGPYFETEFVRTAGSPLWYLFYLGNVPEAFGREPPFLLGHLWSLAIEEQFYLAFPLIALVLDRRRLTAALILAIVLAPALRLFTLIAAPDRERIQYLAAPCRMDVIAVGCLLAVLARRRTPVAIFRPDVARSLLLGSLTVCITLIVGGALERTTPFGRVAGYSVVATACGALVLYALSQRGAAETAWLRFAPLGYIGKISYGAYIFHRPADVLVEKLLDRIGLMELQPSVVAIGAKVAVTVGLATVSWRVLERPLLRFKSRFALAGHPSEALGLPSPQSGEVTRADTRLEIFP